MAIAFVVFLFAHAFVHVAVWAMSKPAQKPAPFDPTHSWALAAGHVAPSSQRTTSVALAWIAAALFGAAGVALAFDASAWRSLAVLAAAVGLALKGLCFNRWLGLGVVLDIAVMVIAVMNWPST